MKLTEEQVKDRAAEMLDAYIGFTNLDDDFDHQEIRKASNETLLDMMTEFGYKLLKQNYIDAQQEKQKLVDDLTTYANDLNDRLGNDKTVNLVCNCFVAAAKSLSLNKTT
jgi:hypothetical protein